MNSRRDILHLREFADASSSPFVYIEPNGRKKKQCGFGGKKKFPSQPKYMSHDLRKAISWVHLALITPTLFQ
jgi:hypothetical protein